MGTPAVVLLNKPTDLSSFAALGRVKRVFETRRVGHTGTLDPFAGGLLVVVVGTATKCARYFTGLEKTYVARVRFGAETTTGDRTGDIVRTAALPADAQIRDVLPRFRGEISQVPPAYSAIHVNGKRAYELARNGQEIELPERAVTVRQLTAGSIEGDTLLLEVTCSSGTYVRTLAVDIARAVGSAAHLVALQRTAVGEFEVSEAIDPEALDRSAALPLATALARAGIELVQTDQGVARRAVHGGAIRAEECNGLHGGIAALCLGDAVIAVGEWVDGVFNYHAVFPTVGINDG